MGLEPPERRIQNRTVMEIMMDGIQHAAEKLYAPAAREGRFRRFRRRWNNTSRLIQNGVQAAWWEAGYWIKLFLYTTRRILHVEVALSLAGAFVFFGWVVSRNLADNPRDLLYYCYLYFSVVTILLTMSLLPRERDEDTLEILWSQPIRRSSLIVIQLLTITFWQWVLCTAVVFFFSQYAAYTEGRWWIVPLVVTSSFAIGAVTVLISTFTRHSMAAGLVALLIFGIHFYWLQQLGPVQIFYHTLPAAPPALRGGPPRPETAVSLLSIHTLIFSTVSSALSYVFGKISPCMPLILNRFFVLALVGFVLDYLFRRLRRTAEWFT